jgi:uncharacterized membrane protein YtjA (UPF0391 family)
VPTHLVPVPFRRDRNSVRINAARRSRLQAASAGAGMQDVSRQDHLIKEANMLSWAVTFLIIAVIAGVLGLSGVAGTATNIAYVLFVVFLIVAAASFVMGRRPPVT